MKIKIRILTVILALASLFSVMGILSSCMGATHTENGVLSVELDGENVVVKIGLSEEYLAAHKRDKVYLLRLDSAGNEATLVKESRTKANITFKVKHDGNVTCGFALAEKADGGFNILTPTYYISNPWELADTSAPTRYPSQFKGLALDSTSELGEAAYLGTGSALFEVRMDKLMLENSVEGAYAHICGGRAYYYDKAYLDSLDSKVKTAASHGMRIYLRFLLGVPEKDDEGKYIYAPIDLLYCNDASSTASAYLPDMGNADAVGYVAAMFDFLAGRYSSAEYGTVSDYIIGKNLNLRDKYNNAGSISTDKYDTYCNYYARLAYNTLSSHVAGGKIYLSISPTWSGSSSGGKSFLNTFLAYSRRGGSFDWGVAASLEAENVGSDSIWEDVNVANPDLTINSLYELSDLLATNAYLHDGKPRSAIVSDFRITTTAKNDSDSHRASSYLYAYYKLLDYGAFNALFYSNFSDDKYGLKAEDGTCGALYGIYHDCGSNITKELSAYAGIVGNKWSLLPKDILTSKISTKYFSVDSTEVDSKRLKNELALYDFSSGSLHDFGVSGGIYACALEATVESGDNETLSTTVLSTKIHGDSGRSALIRRGIKLSDLSSAKYMAIDISSQSGPENAMLYIKQRTEGGDIVFFKEFTISGNEEVYYFDVSEFIKAADKKSDIELYLYFIPEDAEDDAEIHLRSINLYSATNAQGIITAVIIAIMVVIVLAAGGVIAFNIIRRKSGNDDEDDDDEE